MQACLHETDACIPEEAGTQQCQDIGHIDLPAVCRSSKSCAEVLHNSPADLVTSGW